MPFFQILVQILKKKSGLKDIDSVNDFNGKVALITGSTSGIGKAIALLLGSSNAYVFVTGRNIERGNEVVQEIVSNGGKSEFIKADLADFSTHKTLIDQIISKAGRLDILVNNHAILPNPGSNFEKKWFERYR